MENIDINQDPKIMIKNTLTGLSPEKQVEYANELVSSGLGPIVAELISEFDSEVRDEISDSLLDNIQH